MAYATPENLLSWFGAEAMTGLGDPDGDRRIEIDLMRATVLGLDRSGWESNEIDWADQAITRIEEGLKNTSLKIDSYLSGRYTLPLDVAVVAGSQLPKVCGDITHYDLIGSQVLESVQSRYKEAMAWLRDISTGKAKLGGVVVPSVTVVGKVEFTAPKPVFGSGMVGF